MCARLHRRLTAIVLLSAMLAVAGCGSAATASHPGGASVHSPTATVASTPSPTPLPSVDGATVAKTCANFPQGPAVLVGGFAVESIAAVPSSNHDWDALLPDNLPLTPYQVPDDLNATALVANPVLGEYGGDYSATGGYNIEICNISSTAKTLTRVDARIDAVEPYTGTANVHNYCDVAYALQFGQQITGVGCTEPGNIANEYLHAPFAASAGAGATVTTTQVATLNALITLLPVHYGPLPATVQPGQAIVLAVGMGGPEPTTAFAQPGYYTFSFGIGVNGAEPVFAATTPKTLFTPNTRKWTGQNCLAVAQLSQIPASATQTTPFICPPAQ